VKVVFETETSTIDLSGPAAAVDAAFSHLQSNCVSTICHESLELCLPGNSLVLCQFSVFKLFHS